MNYETSKSGTFRMTFTLFKFLGLVSCSGHRLHGGRLNSHKWLLANPTLVAFTSMVRKPLAPCNPGRKNRIDFDDRKFVSFFYEWRNVLRLPASELRHSMPR